MERFEKVMNSLKELDQLGVDNDIIGEIELMLQKTVERVHRQRKLDINRIRLFAIDRRFDFVAHDNVVKVSGGLPNKPFLAIVDVNKKDASIKGDAPFSVEEILQGMTRFEFGEKYGHNNKYLLSSYNEDFIVMENF